MIISGSDEPWQGLDLSRQEVSPVLSMLTDEEVFYAYWLARDYYKGEGVIVDTGCLLGGETVALAKGLVQNPFVSYPKKLIHAFDIFIYKDYMSQMKPDDNLQPGDSLLPFFNKNIEPYKDHIRVYPGNLMKHGWTGVPIEILFVDVAKSWKLNNHVVREFYSSLVPGHSLVVHQDYFWYSCHWIHITMQFFSEYFESVHTTQLNLHSFKLTKNIPAELLTIDYKTYFSNDEMIELIDLAIAQHQGAHKIFVTTAKVSLLIELKAYDRAHGLVEEIKQLPEAVDVSVMGCIERVEQLLLSKMNIG